MNNKYYDHPPNCMADYCNVLSVRAQAALDDHLTEGSVGFGIKCSCGNTSLSVKGEMEPDSDTFFGPIIIICDKCKNESLIFDPTKNGYDGEFDQFDATFDGQYEKIYKCEKCNNHKFEVSVLLEVQYDDKETFNEEQRRRLEDFFNSIAFHCICDACGHDAWISTIECA